MAIDKDLNFSPFYDHFVTPEIWNGYALDFFAGPVFGAIPGIAVLDRLYPKQDKLPKLWQFQRDAIGLASLACVEEFLQALPRKQPFDVNDMKVYAAGALTLLHGQKICGTVGNAAVDLWNATAGSIYKPLKLENGPQHRSLGIF